MSLHTAHNPLDTLDSDTPVTVEMLRHAIDDLGQGVGFVISSALTKAGLTGNQCTRIAQELHTSMEQGAFHGAAGDVVAGIVYGISLQLQGDPGAVGKRDL